MIDLKEMEFMFTKHWIGYNHRMPLKILCDYFKEDGRTVRMGISKLREKGFLIASNCKAGGGYYLVTQDMINRDQKEREQIMIMIKENYSRRERLREMIEPFDNLIKNRKPAEQIKMKFPDKARALTY